MEFKRYNDIENSYRSKTINEIYDLGYDKQEWVVTEKVHGSNCAFYLNHEGIRFAKRSGFVKVGEKFFEWENVVDAYEEHLKLLYAICTDLITSSVEDCEGEIKGDIEVILYGELFGGTYPHKDVEKDPTAVKVQKGVYYCPWNDFYAFDLKINGRFVHYDIFEEIMQNIGFHFAKALYRGYFKTCLAYPNDFQTRIPDKMELPDGSKLPKIDNNITEGVVIKPVHALYFNNGARVILKNKNENYKEVAKKEKKIVHKPDISLDVNENILFLEAVNYITENRLRNVISHEGEITDKMFGKIAGLFIKDVMDDFKKDFEDRIQEIKKKRFNVIKRNIQIKCNELIRKHFLNIIDGEF